MADKPKNFFSKMERWMGFVAVLIATMAALAAIYEARMNRKHQEISVWPYMQMWAGVDLAPAGNRKLSEAFSYNMANKGVGPAIIEDISLVYNGKTYRHWSILLRTIAKENDLDMQLVQRNMAEANLVAGDVIEAGEVRWVIKNDYLPLAHIMARKFYGENAIKLSTCYCSLYDQCWQLTNSTVRPKPVASCKVETPTIEKPE